MHLLSSVNPMPAGAKHIVERIASAVRKAGASWWGGIGCRVGFIITAAAVVVSAFVGSYLYWEADRSRHKEIQSRAEFLARFYAFVLADEIRAGDRDGIARTLQTAVPLSGERTVGLAHILVYDRAGAFLAGGTSGPGRQVPAFRGEMSGAPLTTSAYRSQILPDGTYDLLLPVPSERGQIGSVRVGISPSGIRPRFEPFSTMTFAAAAGVLLFGMAISRIIAVGVVKPVTRLSAAVAALNAQNWKAPIPVHGKDELSRLASAVNQLAHTLQKRETSLSRGNRELFILHTAGLDLLENLDLPVLLGRIAARAEDLIRSETTTIAVVDRQTKVLAYLCVEGRRAQLLRDQELPLEAGGIYNWLVSYGTPLLIRDARNDFRLDAGLMGTLGVKSIMTVPLWSSNSLIAVLTAVNKKGGDAFDKHDLRLFTVLSNLVGAALQNALLYADLKNKVSELNSTQEQLVHSSRLAAIGELAANLAHEINNPLTSVLGYTSHLIKTVDLSDESRRKMTLIEQETLRVRKIIRSLLDFARQRTSWKEPGDVVKPLREMVALVQGVAERASVHIEEQYPHDPAIVSMDQNELKQVFLNIMNNALHAMPEGGVLRIRLEPDGEGEIAVVFEDTGHGIPPGQIGRIFEPFFSTKSGADGTGLGLSISSRIVQDHGGRIDVKSESGSGSVFRVVLPLRQRQPVS